MRLWRVDSYQADNLLDAHRVLRSNVVAAVDLAVKMIASASFARWPQLGGVDGTARTPLRWSRTSPVASGMVGWTIYRSGG